MTDTVRIMDPEICEKKDLYTLLTDLYALSGDSSQCNMRNKELTLNLKNHHSKSILFKDFVEVQINNSFNYNNHYFTEKSFLKKILKKEDIFMESQYEAKLLPKKQRKKIRNENDKFIYLQILELQIQRIIGEIPPNADIDHIFMEFCYSMLEFLENKLKFSKTLFEFDYNEISKGLNDIFQDFFIYLKKFTENFYVSNYISLLETFQVFQNSILKYLDLIKYINQVVTKKGNKVTIINLFEKNLLLIIEKSKNTLKKHYLSTKDGSVQFYSLITQLASHIDKISDFFIQNNAYDRFFRYKNEKNSFYTSLSKFKSLGILNLISQKTKSHPLSFCNKNYQNEQNSLFMKFNNSFFSKMFDQTFLDDFRQKKDSKNNINNEKFKDENYANLNCFLGQKNLVDIINSKVKILDKNCENLNYFLNQKDRVNILNSEVTILDENVTPLRVFLNLSSLEILGSSTFPLKFDLIFLNKQKFQRKTYIYKKETNLCLDILILNLMKAFSTFLNVPFQDYDIVAFTKSEGIVEIVEKTSLSDEKNYEEIFKCSNLNNKNFEWNNNKKRLKGNELILKNENFYDYPKESEENKVAQRYFSENHEISMMIRNCYSCKKEYEDKNHLKSFNNYFVYQNDDKSFISRYFQVKTNQRLNIQKLIQTSCKKNEKTAILLKSLDYSENKKTKYLFSGNNQRVLVKNTEQERNSHLQKEECEYYFLKNDKNTYQYQILQLEKFILNNYFRKNGFFNIFSFICEKRFYVYHKKQFYSIYTNVNLSLQDNLKARKLGIETKNKQVNLYNHTINLNEQNYKYKFWIETKNKHENVYNYTINLNKKDYHNELGIETKNKQVNVYNHTINLNKKDYHNYLKNNIFNLCNSVITQIHSNTENSNLICSVVKPSILKNLHENYNSLINDYKNDLKDYFSFNTIFMKNITNPKPEESILIENHKISNKNSDIRKSKISKLENFNLRNSEYSYDEKFVNSLAFHILMTYLLGIGDRTENNYGISLSNIFFQYDFSFICGSNPIHIHSKLFIPDFVRLKIQKNKKFKKQLISSIMRMFLEIRSKIKHVNELIISEIKKSVNSYFSFLEKEEIVTTIHHKFNNLNESQNLFENICESENSNIKNKNIFQPTENSKDFISVKNQNFGNIKKTEKNWQNIKKSENILNKFYKRLVDQKKSNSLQNISQNEFKILEKYHKEIIESKYLNNSIKNTIPEKIQNKSQKIGLKTITVLLENISSESNKIKKRMNLYHEDNSYLKNISMIRNYFMEKCLIRINDTQLQFFMENLLMAEINDIKRTISQRITSLGTFIRN